METILLWSSAMFRQHLSGSGSQEKQRGSPRNFQVLLPLKAATKHAKGSLTKKSGPWALLQKSHWLAWLPRRQPQGRTSQSSFPEPRACCQPRGCGGTLVPLTYLTLPDLTLPAAASKQHQKHHPTRRLIASAHQTAYLLTRHFHYTNV